MTAWGANWLEPSRLPVRLLLVGLMFASLLMSLAPAEGVAALAILAPATAPLTLLAGIVASTAVLVAVAVAETVGTT